MRRILLMSALALLSAGPAMADLALATSKNCMACHTVDKKVLGPAFKDIAAKYKDDKTAPEKLAVKIMKGSSGVWGSLAMPANTQVSESEAARLAAWVLSAK
ncbi:c-type cytochrome [Variovorax rhizosphaerae]|uniref:C-type cytochrome n=1 Tax=Variovorax rhizosphaerae TaxID=1836200 RepID=A0ABU8WKE7_9BURK